VPDVRPYLQHARLVVAPLRIARGVQNKVLEAMAMARPVVATSNAVQGIADAALGGVRLVDDPAAMAQAFISSLQIGRRSVDLGRAFVKHRFSWEESVRRLSELLGTTPGIHPDGCPGAGAVAHEVTA